MQTTEQIWQAYHARLRAFILSRIPDGWVADDLLQDVFLKLHAGLASLNDETKLTSWLYQITRNAIADYHRAQRPTVELSDGLPHPDTGLEADVTRELSHCLLPMIEQLPDGYREAIILSELEGHTQKEVAEIQGLSLSGAKSRVQRGRAKLREMLAACCRFEFDAAGRLSGYEPIERSCEGSC